jgi:predicted PurR-regulated permease PerM
MKNFKSTIPAVVSIIVGVYFLMIGLVASKAFLAPVATALVLALIILPLARKIEWKFINRNIASLISTLIIFIFSLLFIGLCSLQIKSFVNDWPSIKETMKPEIEDFKEFLFEHTPIDKESLETYYPSNSLPILEQPLNDGARALSFMRGVMSFFSSYLLTFVYIFFILNYRRHYKSFLLKVLPDHKESEGKTTINKSAEVVQDYLIGRLILMAILAVLYTVGLGLSGVNNYIIIGVIASILTLIPWIGNLIGLAMAMAFGYFTSGDANVLWGIIITFTVSQFFESYILQPYIVGDKVGLHPFFVILFVILGGSIWGLIGMVLAIPLMAMLTVVFQNIQSLQPLGFLFSKNTE